ncbi:YdcF family protein [Brevibacillus fluminis]|uniref:YdcF family protein n=1 Tax=Brevibacillus fluminis TaxID=511487 RepID=UPI003F899F60
MRGQRSRKFIAFVLLIVIVWSGFILHRINEVERQAMPHKADVAIVLGAAVWGDVPSPGLSERLDVAVAMYHEHYVPKLIVSGGLGTGKQVAEAVAMQRYLIQKGVPEQDILLEDQSHSTFENLVNSKQLMLENGFATALVISHGYHLARAVDIASTLHMTVFPVAAETHVLFVPYHKAREILAYTKWKVMSLIGEPE